MRLPRIGWPRRRRDEDDGAAWLERRRRRRRNANRLFVAAIVVAAIVFVVEVALHLYVDWLWYGEVGLRVVFWRRFTYGVVLGAIFAAVFFVIVYGALEWARRLGPKRQVFEGIADEEFVRHDVARFIRRFGRLLIAVIALAVGYRAAGSWPVFARAAAPTKWGAEDPIFKHDIGFYVFTLPAWQYVLTFITMTLFVAIVVAVVVHFALGGIEVLFKIIELRFRRDEQADGPGPAEIVQKVRRIKGIKILPGAAAQLSALLAAFLVLVAVNGIVRGWTLLYSTAGAVYGAGYTDVHVRLPLIRVAIILTLLLAAGLAYNAWRLRRGRWLAAGVVAWFALELVLLSIVPAAWQALFVNPNQLEKESPYLGYELAATRAAYDLTAIREAPYRLRGELSSNSLAGNAATVENIRRWDPETLQRSYRQLQQLRPYYAFTTVSVDRYRIDGAYRQTMLSPREFNQAGLPPQARTWVNEHITYTHGYGVAVSAVNQVANDGSPAFLVKDVPVSSSVPALSIAQPRIYYGLLGTDYTLVKTKSPEFDYPGEGGDVYRRYDGRGGIPVSSWFTRLAFAARFGTIKFLTTSVFTDESRVIVANALSARLEKAAPFLTFDDEPYMVVADGRLYWIADAYTTSARVPYSEPSDGVNYIRNAVKVVIDAYDGSMTFYAFDESDPLLRTYERLFPGMFRPAAEMNPTLRAHVRYPQDMFALQAKMFATYHVTDPGVLYNKGDQWQIPTNVSITGAGEMQPYYMIMKLPGEKREEFMQVLPLTPNLRSNMIGWLGARSDPPNYGKAISFEFPANVNVYGPAQVEAAVNQDPTISSQRTLWGQRGSRVIFGNLLVVPIDDALLYVQPLYLESEETQLPQVQRMIVFYRSTSASPDLPGGRQQNVVMAATLGDALAEIFGTEVKAASDRGIGGAGGSASGGGAGAPDLARLAALANSQYDASQRALKAGNLTEFARQIDALGATLKRMRR